MPNRILKESITTSETIDRLSAEEERFFYRLLVVCDDYGRYDARPAIIIGHCFPLKIGQVTEKHVMAWLFTLQDAGLIRYYKVDGRPYLQVVTWERHQQKRAKHSKFPPPMEGDSPSDSLQSDASACNQLIAQVLEKRETRNEKRETNMSASAAAIASVRQVFDHYQKHIQPNCRYLDAARKKIQTRLNTYSSEELMQAINRFKTDGWWMEKNGNRGAAWFFDSDTRIEQFMNLLPRASPNSRPTAPDPRDSITAPLPRFDELGLPEA